MTTNQPNQIISDLADPRVYGVPQGPCGAYCRDEHGIQNGDYHDQFSTRGLEALKKAHIAFLQNGCTMAAAHTFRLSNLRAFDGKDGQWNHNAGQTYELDHRVAAYNDQALLLAREVFGDDVPLIGLLGPIADTCGGDDAAWETLGEQQEDWVFQRQLPQIRRLYDPKAVGDKKPKPVDIAWVEAQRYLRAAKSITRATVDSGGDSIVHSWEAASKGIPDPRFENDYCSFADAKSEILDAVGGRIKYVMMSANCIGVTALERHLENEEDLDGAYINDRDWGSEAAQRIHRPRFDKLAEKGDTRTVAEEREFQSYLEVLETPEEKFEEIWRRCLEAKFKFIGICCCNGKKAPEFVRRARAVYDQYQLEQSYTQSRWFTRQ